MSLVRAIGGALQGFGAGVSQMAVNAKEREGEAYRRAYQERVFGLQQDQFDFQKEQAGIENERAAAQFEFQQQQHDDNLAHRNKTLDLENARLQAQIENEDWDRMVQLSTETDPLTGEPVLNKEMLSARVEYRKQFGNEKPTDAEMLFYMHSHRDRPELRQFVRGQEYDWSQIAQMVDVLYPGEPDFMFALKSTRDSLRAVKAVVPDGDPPAGLAPAVETEDPTLPTRPTPAGRRPPTATAPDTSASAPPQQVPHMDLTEIGLGIPPAGPFQFGQAGESGGMGATPHMDLSEIGLGIPPASGGGLALRRGPRGGPMGATPPMDLTELGLGIPPGTPPSGGGLVANLPPPQQPAGPNQSSPPAQPVRANQFSPPSQDTIVSPPSQPTDWGTAAEPPPPMNLTEIGLGLKAVIDAGLMEAPARDTPRAQPKRTGKRSTEAEAEAAADEGRLDGVTYSWEQIREILNSPKAQGVRDRGGNTLAKMRDILAEMGASVPSGDPPG